MPNALWICPNFSAQRQLLNGLGTTEHTFPFLPFAATAMALALWGLVRATAATVRARVCPAKTLGFTAARGKKSKNAKVAVVGVLYTLKSTRKGIEGPINKRTIGTFESHEALFQWLLPEARKRGYGRKLTVFVADGCDHIWRLQQRYFPDAIARIDFWHITEKLWEAGPLLFKEGTSQTRQWYDEQKRLLRGGKVRRIVDRLGEFIASVSRTGPRNKWRRKRLLDIQKHLVEHSSRMRYDRLRRNGLVIGAGAVEGAVRNIVGLRLDGPGMRWGRGRSERILHLRCILVNGQWDLFHAYLDRHVIRLRSQPMPTVPHEAKKAARTYQIYL